MGPNRFRRFRVVALVVLGLGLLLPALGAAITFLSDDGGRPAPVCSFLGSSGVPEYCASNNPLPVTGGALTSAQDPIGYGRFWTQSTNATPPNGRQWTGIMLDQNNVVAYGPTTGLTLQANCSRDGGRTFGVCITNTAQAIGDQLGVIRLTDGSYISVGQTSGGAAAAFRTTSFATFANATGLPAAIATATSVLQQGGTILVTTNISTSAVCRSTDNGATYSCVDPAGFTTAGRMALASPAAGVWLTVDTLGAIARSTDDGTIFTVVATIAPADVDNQGIICLTSTVCLYSAGTSVRRSTDAGLTWGTTVFTVPSGTGRIGGFANFGGGVVAAVMSPTISGTQTLAFRSTDLGLTWLPASAGVNTTFPNGNGVNGISTSGGAAFYTIHSTAGGALPNSQGVYSAAIGAGQTQIKGDNGATWQLDNNGSGIVAQALAVTGNGIQSLVSVPWFVTVPALNGTNLTSSTVSAANAVNTVTLTGVANTRISLYHVSAFCSPAGASTITIAADGGTIVWRGTVPTQPAVVSENFTGPIQNATVSFGQNMVVTAQACGVGNTSTINVVANRY